MINVIAPTRLMYVGHRKHENDATRFFFLPLEGESRLVDDKLFIDDPNISAHEHYLVHGKLSGGVTVGCQTLINGVGQTISEYYADNSDFIYATNALYCYDPKCNTYLGNPYPSDAYSYYFVVREKDGKRYAVLYFIQYRPQPEYSKAPYWMQIMGHFGIDHHPTQADTYRYWEMYGYAPTEKSFSSLQSAIAAIESTQDSITFKSNYTTLVSPSRKDVFSGENNFKVASYDIGRLPNIKNFFKFKEFQWVPYNTPIGMSDSYSFQHLRQSAFWDAISDIKTLNQNTVTTIIEVIQFLMKVKSGKFKISEIIPNSLSNLWLQYRYQYSTTKLDVEEALKFVEWSGVFAQKSTFFVRGAFATNGVKCICKVTVKNRFLSLACEWWTKLYKYGLQPNFYLVWDMTPFSFIVDWFLPVGDLCSIIDSYNNITDTYDCVNVVYSLQYGAAVGSGGVVLQASLYSRWVEKHFPTCEFCYLYDGNNPSDKTILFRCLDAVSLILGRK